MKKLLLVLIPVCLLSNLVQATTVNISSCDDAWVGWTWNWPQVNERYWSDGLGIETHSDNYSWSTGSYQYISYVKFDLSSLQDNAVITSASLNLYVNSNGSDSSPGIYHADDNWEEETVVYSTRPINDSTIAAAGSWSNIANQWVSFTLSTWSYQADLSDNYLTVMLYALGNGGNDSRFVTKEYSGGNYAPYLSIEIPEPATIFMLVIGSLTFIRKKIKNNQASDAVAA
ncbi:MAG: DNRLRE domain-containing protein [Phycisphaerae bacterium]|jgi:hypothetical protein